MERKNEALNKSISAFQASIISVTMLMPLRTIITNQQKYGGNLLIITRKMYEHGKIPRFYSGYFYSLSLVSSLRFGYGFINSTTQSKFINYPLFLSTGVESVLASSYRFLLYPIDTLKNYKQVYGLEKLKMDIVKNNYKHLFSGSLSAAASTLISHYPFFLTYNFLQQRISEDKKTLITSGLIGFVSTTISDIFSNGFRVIKVIKQTSDKKIYKYI